MVNGTTAALVPYLQYALRHIGVLPDPVIVQAQVQGFLCFQADRDIFARLQVGKKPFTHCIEQQAGLLGKI